MSVKIAMQEVTKVHLLEEDILYLKEDHLQMEASSTTKSRQTTCPIKMHTRMEVLALVNTATPCKKYQASLVESNFRSNLGIKILQEQLLLLCLTKWEAKET